MARTGDRVLPEDLLHRPQHSIIEQGLRAKPRSSAANGDGFGVGWYGNGSAPAAYESTQYTSTHLAWHDENLREVAGQIHAPLLLAHVRASTGTPVQRSNCHPFRYGRWSWMHNGSIAGSEAVERDLSVAVDESTVIVVTFAFCSTIGDHTDAGITLEFFGASRRLVTISRIAVICSVGVGTLLARQTVPSNLVTVLLLRKWALVALADHERQRAAGVEPTSSRDSSDLPARVPTNART